MSTWMKNTLSSALIVCGLTQAHGEVLGLMEMTDQQLSDITGQALMSLSYIAPKDSDNLMNGKFDEKGKAYNIGFYKLGLEAELELNANIRNLQLGCGGVNNAAKNNSCDIDIKNLSLSGLNDGEITGDHPDKGSPTFSGGRPSSSGKITNPFVEFAISNPDSPSTREIKGMRFSAEKINALLSAGMTNGSELTDGSAKLDDKGKPTGGFYKVDGIQTLSGFMQIANTTGSVKTKDTLFGASNDQRISGLLTATILGTHNRVFTSDPGDKDNHGISIPEMNPEFSMPGFQVNGKRTTTAEAKNISVNLAEIPMTAGPNNQLVVTYDPILAIASKAKFQMASGSKVQNLWLDVTFNQSLSMIHNIPLKGTGGYLSLQDMALLWPGSYIDGADKSQNSLASMNKSDVAQTGWWMSFAEPVQLGYLEGTNAAPIDAVLPQVASLTTAELMKEINRVSVSGGEALGSLFNYPISKQIIVDLDAATNPFKGGTPATITLANLQLKNQQVASNCYGALKFC